MYLYSPRPPGASVCAGCFVIYIEGSGARIQIQMPREPRACEVVATA